LRKEFDAAWTDADTERAESLYKEMRAEIRKIDKAHNAALWQEVRETFDYLVFTAAPSAVGITSTGAEGPNQLPAVLKAYRVYEDWMSAGAKPERMPSFDTVEGAG